MTSEPPSLAKPAIELPNVVKESLAHWERRHSCRRLSIAPETHTSRKGGGSACVVHPAARPNIGAPPAHVRDGDRNVAAPIARHLRSAALQNFRCEWRRTIFSCV